LFLTGSDGFMSHPKQKCGCPDVCLLELLLDLMKAQGALPWPGADGLTLEEVLAEYPRAAREGRVPTAAQLSRCFPHLGAEVELATKEGSAQVVLARCRKHGGR
jgi:hypothetical protein